MGEPDPENWALSRMAANGVPADKIASFAGRRHDHLPLTDVDWTFMTWVAEQIPRLQGLFDQAFAEGALAPRGC